MALRSERLAIFQVVNAWDVHAILAEILAGSRSGCIGGIVDGVAELLCFASTLSSHSTEYWCLFGHGHVAGHNGWLRVCSSVRFGATWLRSRMR